MSLKNLNVAEVRDMTRAGRIIFKFLENKHWVSFFFKPPDLDATELDGSVKIQRLKVLLQIVVPHLNYCRIVIIIIIGINKIVMIIIGKVAAF